MNKRRSIIGAAVFVVIAIVVLWLARQDSRKRDQNQSAVTSAAPAPAIANNPASITTASSATPPAQTKRDAMQTVIQLFNHKPIEFYGRVLDQNEQPVRNVDVYGSAIYNTGAAGGTQRKQTKTDSSGIFSFEGMAGRTFGIGLEKEGYEYGGGQGPFQYTELVGEAERHRPDRSKPVVFHIWKLQGPEPLIEGNKNFRVSNDGTPVRINLHTGKVIAEGGDLVVRLQYQQTKVGPFEWTMELEAPGGGLFDAERKITAMFSAPNAGYEPSIKVQMDANSPEWRQAIDRNLYIKTTTGNYGKISLHAGTNRADPFGLVTLRWSFNPKVGSQVLEPKQTEKALNP